jgi:hypothetical protein
LKRKPSFALQNSSADNKSIKGRALEIQDSALMSCRTIVHTINAEKVPKRLFSN